MSSLRIDLGQGHAMSWFTLYGGEPQHAGVIVSHPLRPDDHICAWAGECRGAVMFDGAEQRTQFPDRPRWTVVQIDPLTITPSLDCHCGDHGFILAGRWVAA